ncbi:tRNA (cytosine(34)-C(5))-methyltransferase, mitochondrial [Neosynchiropus ocellatus]
MLSKNPAFYTRGMIRFKRRRRALKPVRHSCSSSHTSVADNAFPSEPFKRSTRTKITKAFTAVRSPCQGILSHFDHQYSAELEELWKSARAVLLDPSSWQYGVLLNRFAADTHLKQILLSHGFSTLLPRADGFIQSSLESQAEHIHQSECGLDDPGNQPVTNSPVPSLSSTLQCYVHPHVVRFPPQTHRPGQLKQYYLLNAASLLPVLALKVQDGEKVLDLCSAPGGKSIAIMQSATPDVLCCNEPDPHRRGWLAKTLESFLPQQLNTRVIVSAHDGRAFGQIEAGTYDKVLVDAPCSNDRSWLFSSGSDQVEKRLSERAGLPALQAQLLRSALTAVRPGGTVVYSTCTLSSLENFAVVETVLKDCPDAEVEDLWEEIGFPLSDYFTFHPARQGQVPRLVSSHPQGGAVSLNDHRLGLLVVPQPSRTWGPMFLSRIRRRA